MLVSLYGKNTDISHGRIIYILFHEHVEGGKKYKKAYVTSVANIAMWLYQFLAGSETKLLLLKNPDRFFV